MGSFTQAAEPEERRSVAMIEIVCESRYDVALYQLLCGEPSVSGIEFTVPRRDPSIVEPSRTDTGGYRSVSSTCRFTRSFEPHGRSIFGLLDGEEAARFGRGCELYEDPQLVFTIDDPSAAGLLFLGVYEKENLYLRYGNAVEMMRSRLHADLRIGGQKEPRTGIREAFDASIKASIVKYATKSMMALNASRFDQSRIKFVEKKASDAIGRTVKKIIDAPTMLKEAAQGWAHLGLAREFVERMSMLSDLSRSPLSETVELQLTRPELLSVCDGAMFMQLVLGSDRKYLYEDMAAGLEEGDFGTQLRDALLAAVRGRAVHVAPDERDYFSNREPLALRLLDKWRA